MSGQQQQQPLVGPQPDILPATLLQQPILQPALPVKGQALNNLFKTQLCKHFQQSKQCVKGNGCHFAHGEVELRRKDEVSEVWNLAWTAKRVPLVFTLFLDHAFSEFKL